MQRTTLSTYPLLISVKPIKGVVYKATQLSRPHPKISVMSVDEVQKHEKRESADMTTKLRRKRDRYSPGLNLRPPIRDPMTAAPAVVETHAEHGVLAQPANERPRVILGNRNSVPISRLKKVLKKVFKPMDATKSSIDCRKDKLHAPNPSPNNTMQAGFRCNTDGCASCSSSPPSTPLPHDPIGRSLMTAPQVEPILEAASSFESGCTTTQSASSGTCSILSPTSIDLDIFADFDGVYIEPTPPQLAHISPSSAFVEKIRDTMIWHAIEDLAADSSSSASEDDLDDTHLTTPDIPLTPKVSMSTTDEWYSANSSPCRDIPPAPLTPKVSSDYEDWHSTRSTPRPCGLEVPYDQREWSFEISSTAMRVLRNTGCAAQARRVRQD